MTRRYATLDDRCVISLRGPDAKSFLQGLITNDVDKLTSDGALYAALLSPQGKFLHDFFLVEFGDGLAVESELGRRDDLMRRLTMYRLRADVVIEDVTDTHQVAVLWSDPSDDVPSRDGIAKLYADPRLADLGWRAILDRAAGTAPLADAGWEAASAADYDAARIALGVPDGSRDLLVDKTFALEGNFDELNGVDFDKGCFVGQENTTRQKHRGAVRKRLMRVDFDGPPPPPDTPIMLGDREAGTMRSSVGQSGIAVLRLEQIEQAAAGGEPLVAGDTQLTPVKPDWAGY
jgi:hypothetical protein